MSDTNHNATGARVYRQGGTDVAIADGGTGTSSLPSGLLTGDGTNAITAKTYTSSTYTPIITLAGGTGNVVPQHSTATGVYVRIADLVYVEIDLNGDGGSEGAGTGEMNISLPIQASSSTNLTFFMPGKAFNSPTHYLLVAEIGANSTTLALNYWSSFTAVSSFTGADQSASSRYIRLKFCYKV